LKLNFKAYTMFNSFAKTMDEECTYKANKMMLFHGTGFKNTKSIVYSGFNRTYQVTNAYGCGTYFALKFSESMRDTYSPPDAADGTGYRCGGVNGFRSYRCGTTHAVATRGGPAAWDGLPGDCAIRICTDWPALPHGKVDRRSCGSPSATCQSIRAVAD
jgi:hypothetical protein